MELTLEGTRHSFIELPCFVFGSFASHTLQKDGRTWLGCVYCVYMGAGCCGDNSLLLIKL